jgi:hypothetical protein
MTNVAMPGVVWSALCRGQLSGTADPLELGADLYFTRAPNPAQTTASQTAPAIATVREDTLAFIDAGLIDNVKST